MDSSAAAADSASPSQSPHPTGSLASEASTSHTAAAAQSPAESTPPQATSQSGQSYGLKQKAAAHQPAKGPPLDTGKSASAQVDADKSPAGTTAPQLNAAQAPSSSSGSATSPATSPAQPQASAAGLPDSKDTGHAEAALLQSEPSTSAPGSRTSRVHSKRPWPLVRRGKGDGSSGVLVDKYSSVVSDSDTSEEEDMQQPDSLLGNINAKEIQSGEAHQAVIAPASILMHRAADVDQ